MADQRREQGHRPSPEALLEKAKKEESRAGRLKIFWAPHLESARLMRCFWKLAAD